jgi:hypothetical protein
VAARWLRRLGRTGWSCSWVAERRKRRNPSKLGSRSGESSPCRSRSPKRQLGRWSTTASAVRREHLFDGRREAGARFAVGPIPGLVPTRLGQLRIAPARAQRAELWDRKLGCDRALCFRPQQGGLASIPLGASVERGRQAAGLRQWRSMVGTVGFEPTISCSQSSSQLAPCRPVKM